MSEEIKKITLTGTAATEMGGAQSGKKERVKRRGGEQNAPTTTLKPVANVINVPAPAPAPANAPSNAPANAPSNAPAPSNGMKVTPAPANPNLMEGGTRVIKVELKKRATAKRVHLQPKRADQAKAKPQPLTKKARKVTLAVSALHKRMSRAKKMTRKAKEMSLPQLREHLIQKKLIKPTSKAPEVILRQIAADASIVAGKAL